METKLESVTLRSLILGLVMIFVNAYWLVMVNDIWDSVDMTLVSLFFNAVFTLFVLILINFLVKKLLPKFAILDHELLVIYVMVVTVCTITGTPAFSYLIGIMIHPFWFATPENEYEALFQRYIPEWFTVRDESVLKGYFYGESTLYTIKHIKAWIIPVLSWSAFGFVLWFVLMCINIVLRKQWTENERLTYPITQLPLDMTSGSRFFTNKLMWIAFSIVAFIQILNGLHFYWPLVPALPLKKINIAPFFTEKPWNAIETTFISFYPFIIGLTFLIPLDLAFSCWFFYLFGKAERILASTMGWRTLYYDNQSQGAWLIFGFIALWMSRKHIKMVFKRIITGKFELNDSDEPMKYSYAVLGAIGGIVFLMLFSFRAGMTPIAIIVFFAILIILAISLTKVRAQLGPPVHEIIFDVSPSGIMVSTIGTRYLKAPNLTVLSFYYWFNRCNRAHPMPNQLEAFKIADKANINKKHIMLVILLTTAISMPMTFWLEFHVLYKYGALTKAKGYINYIGFESFGRLCSFLTNQRGSNYVEMAFMMGGSVFTLFLSYMKLRFIWWPFHPAGYVLSGGSWGGMTYVWSAVLITSIAKQIILRTGGLRMYRKAIPFFLGLVLGDYSIGCIWSIIGIAFGIPIYCPWE